MVLETVCPVAVVMDNVVGLEIVVGMEIVVGVEIVVVMEAVELVVVELAELVVVELVVVALVVEEVEEVTMVGVVEVGVMEDMVLLMMETMTTIPVSPRLNSSDYSTSLDNHSIRPERSFASVSRFFRMNFTNSVKLAKLLLQIKMNCLMR